MLDIYTGDLVDYSWNCQYFNITTTPLKDILITDGYTIRIFTNNKISDIKCIEIPINTDGLQFHEYNENTLKITCYEFLNWEKEIELYLDCELFKWKIVR